MRKSLRLILIAIALIAGMPVLHPEAGVPEDAALIPVGCGDGAVVAPETCDPPGVPPGLPNECRADCTFCGDGILDFDIELITNGNFEVGAFTGWGTFDQAGSAGSFILSTPGVAMPTSGNPTSPNPVGGAFYAVTDQSAPAANALLQPFKVPAGATRVVLSFQMFVDNWSAGGGIVDPIGLDYTGPPNQHARVDILLPAAGPLDTGAGVVANYYLGVDPLFPPPNPYTPYSIDITANVIPGNAYVLRFAQVDNQFFQHQGVDNVSILATVMEECDDGNNLDGDECSANCAIEDNLQGNLLGSTGAAGSLIDIDRTTGAGVFRAPHGAFGSVTEIEFRSDRLLVGATGGGASTLIEIDPITGAESFRCTHTFGAIQGLEYVGNTLYGTLVPGGGGGSPSSLVIVGDPFLGVCPLTTVGATGFNNIGGLAYNKDTSTMYGCTSGGVSGGDLVTCSLVTGACVPVGPTGFTECSALEFSQDGELFGGIGGTDLAAGDFIRINPASGAAVSVGPTGFPVLSGLAFVPGPDDDLMTATPINCPSFGATLEITPLGDTDYFHLTGPPLAGVTIDIDAAQMGSTLDSVLGVFDVAPIPFAVSDDDPAPGEPFTLDSYLQVVMPPTGEMDIAVSSFPDFNFNGGLDSDTTGPYMISVACGALPPGDLLGSTASALTLIDINEATGAGVFRAAQGAFGQVTELEFRSDGLLVGATGGGASRLIEIDPMTGVESLRCTHAFGAINGLEYVGNRLYGTFVPGGGGGNPSTLVIVGDPVAGVCSLTTLGLTGFNNIGGLAYDISTGTMYGCTSGGLTGGELVTCNLATGACTSVGPTGFGDCAALEFASHGVLYGGIGGSAPSAGDLIRIDPVTGAGVSIGPTGFSALSGLAFVPFPSDPDGDGVINEKDQCPFSPNPDMGVASFAGFIEATLANNFEWVTPQEVDWVRGPIPGVSTYTWSATGSSAGVTTSFLAPEVPPPGQALYWVFRPDCPLTTWTGHSLGECPAAGIPPCPPGGRDGNLPPP